jgi:hypothetical protein
MKSIETRRVTRTAYVASTIVGGVILFEVAMTCGIVDLNAEWVARYARWGYEPFLKLVGEHPDSRPEWVVPRAGAGENTNAMFFANGFGGMALLPETNDVSSVDSVEEPSVLPATEDAHPPVEPDDDIPVG